MEEISCSKCKKVFEDKDYVVLDWTNTLFHLKCFEPRLNIMKATNTYESIKHRYWFLNKRLTAK